MEITHQRFHYHYAYSFLLEFCYSHDIRYFVETSSISNSAPVPLMRGWRH